MSKLTCLCCDKSIETLYKEPFEPTINLKDACEIEISPQYGSKFDGLTCIWTAIICDECLEKKMAQTHQFEKRVQIKYVKFNP